MVKSENSIPVKSVQDNTKRSFPGQGLKATTLSFIDGVEVRVNPAGMVLFMSDWFRCDEFATRGWFRAEFGGPETMGDTFFYLTNAGRDQAEIESRQPFIPMGAN